VNDREFSDECVWIANSPVLAIDTETTGLHPHEYDRITGIGVANEYKQTYFPLRHPRSDNLSYDQARNLIELLSSPRQRILFHNAIFDWAFLRTDGWFYPQPWRHTWDTMVVRWLIDENAPKKLEDCIADVLGPDGICSAKAQKERQKRIKKIGWSDASDADIQEYGCFDVRHTYDLYLKQQEYISQHADLTVALVREHRFLHVCDEMISHGVRIDIEQAQRKLAECDVGIDRIQSEYPELNFDSPKQLAKLMYSDDGWCIPARNFTNGGQPSTDKDTLLRLLPFEPRIQDIFDYRKLRKARSTYYLPLSERIGRDGRVHAWYRPHGTKTGRLSCSDPNIQTLPNPETLPGIKDCFLPDEGFSLMEYDLEQAELRVAADYADDFVLREHLASGDVHAATAMAMFGHSNGRYRHIGKTINFSALYGIGAAKLSRTARRGGNALIDENQARQYLGQWRNLYAGVTQAMEDAKHLAEERGYVKLWPIGRYRRFDTYAARFENPKDALNSVVQGGIGEFVKEIMMELHRPAERAGVRVVLNVHDSLVCEVPIGMEDEWTSFVRKTAARINPFGISMPVGSKRWD
jgi:DNA polymerase-1